jgi:hypothetical protein
VAGTGCYGQHSQTEHRNWERCKGSAHRSATNSAARTAGCFVRAFRSVRMIAACLKPAARNSSRNAPASLAPAIHENQLAAPDLRCSGKGAPRINSAPETCPPGRTTRANSWNMSSRNGLRLKIPLTSAKSTDESRNGSCSADARTNPSRGYPPRFAERQARSSTTGS